MLDSMKSKEMPSSPKLEGCYQGGGCAPVLAEDEGVEGDQGEVGCIFVACQRCGTCEEGGGAADSSRRNRLCGQPRA